MTLTKEQLDALVDMLNQHMEEDEEEEETEEDEEDEDEIEECPVLPPLQYSISIYKNANSAVVDRHDVVHGTNLSIAAVNEFSSALLVINEKGQAVYSIPWDLVACIKTKEEPAVEKKQALTITNK